MSTPNESMQVWASYLADLGQFAFGLVAIALTIIALTAKRKDLFRSELVKKQIEELVAVRSDLQTVFFNLHYLPFTKFSIESNEGWNTSNLKDHDPSAWAQLEEYKSKSTSIYYKLSAPDYYLPPEWIEARRRQELVNRMKSFAPFTLMAATSHSQDEVDNYKLALVEMRNYIDAQLRAHA